ncbi:MAG: hypothetical protein D6800_00640, partial [Candidatus Zixiibacteriota bacterium]
MRHLATVSAVFMLLAFLGCSSNDNSTGPPAPKTVRVQVTTTATAPSLTSVNDVLWNTVPATAIDISTLNAPKPNPGKAAVVSDSVYLQAIAHNDSLYLRVRWNDPTHDILHNHYEVSQVPVGAQPVN